jgi:pyruvate kinase
MILKETCTRQEAEDITSTLLEGADAFILCHETSLGNYASEAVI